MWVPERLTRMVAMEPVDDDGDDPEPGQHDRGEPMTDVGTGEGLACPDATDK